MFTLTAEGFDREMRFLDQLGKQATFVLAKTLTNTGQMVKKEVTDEMRKVFDRPTPYALRSLYLSPATKTRLETKVWFNEFGGKGTPATKFMAPQVYGGIRGLKRSEKLLQRVGILPPGMVWVPGRGARLDAYGNISPGQITQILSVLSAHREVGFKANITSRSRRTNRKPRDYFATSGRGDGPNPLPAGVWEKRRDGGVKPILIFVRQSSYRPRLPFHQIAEATVRANFSRLFHQNMDQAMRSIR
ncbi:MAG: hypothetical protein WDA20_13980 [Desulfuromonadales bacterium]